MSSLWSWTPVLWKALRFIVHFNYEILSSVIRCDSVTDSTWLQRDSPDWITGRTEPAEPHAWEPRCSTGSLWRAPRTHPGGTGAPSPSAPCCQEQQVPPLWPPQRWPPLWPFPSLRHTNLRWYLLPALAHAGGVMGTAEPKATLTLCRYDTNTPRFGPVVALGVHTPITGLG